jgi:ArsR family transcriptional regulator
MAPALSATSSAIARGFHALSDPTRLEIVELLRDGERCVCELTDSLDAAQSRLSFHLRVLKDADLVTDRREGRWVYYTLNAPALQELETFLSTVRKAPSTPLRGRSSASCCG